MRVLQIAQTVFLAWACFLTRALSQNQNSHICNTYSTSMYAVQTYLYATVIYSRHFVLILYSDGILRISSADPMWLTLLRQNQSL